MYFSTQRLLDEIAGEVTPEVGTKSGLSLGQVCFFQVCEEDSATDHFRGVRKLIWVSA